MSHRASGLPLTAQKELLHCCERRIKRTVLEFFAVGNTLPAVLFVLSRVAYSCHSKNIYSFQGTKVPFFFVAFFHTSLDTI